MQRDKIDLNYLQFCITKVTEKVDFRIQQKGDGAYAGPHETYGILAEEFDELLDALRANDADSFRDELGDIIVGCLIGLASALPADTSATTDNPQEKNA